MPITIRDVQVISTKPGNSNLVIVKVLTPSQGFMASAARPSRSAGTPWSPQSRNICGPSRSAATSCAARNSSAWP